MPKANTTRVTITTEAGTTLEISGLSLKEIKDLAGLNGHTNPATRTTRVTRKGVSLRPSDSIPDYLGFKLKLSDRGKKFVDVLRHHPEGLQADILAAKMGLQTPTQIGGVTGGGMSRLAPRFGVDLENVYISETTFENGVRRTTYKPGKDIAKLQ